MDIRDFFQTILLLLGIVLIPAVSAVLFLHQLVRSNSMISIVHKLLENCLTLLSLIPQIFMRTWDIKITDSVITGVVKLGLFMMTFPFMLLFFFCNDELL